MTDTNIHGPGPMTESAGAPKDGGTPKDGTAPSEPGNRRTTPVKADPATASAKDRSSRHSGPLTTRRARKRYWTIIAILSVAAVGIAFGLLAWDNPLPITDEASGSSRACAGAASSSSSSSPSARRSPRSRSRR